MPSAVSSHSCSRSQPAAIHFFCTTSTRKARRHQQAFGRWERSNGLVVQAENPWSIFTHNQFELDNHLTVKPRLWTRWIENKTPVAVGTRGSNWQISISGSVRVSRTKNRLERNRNNELRFQRTLLRVTCQSTLIFAYFSTGTTNKGGRRRSLGFVTGDSMQSGMAC